MSLARSAPRWVRVEAAARVSVIRAAAAPTAAHRRPHHAGRLLATNPAAAWINQRGQLLRHLDRGIAAPLTVRLSQRLNCRDERRYG